MYVADCRVQASRQEMIEDLEPMAKVCALGQLRRVRMTDDLAVYAREIPDVPTQGRKATEREGRTEAPDFLPWCVLLFCAFSLSS